MEFHFFQQRRPDKLLRHFIQVQPRKGRAEMAKEPKELQWIELLLPANYIRRPMFGGFAYYFEGKLGLVTFESEGDRVYRGKTYEYDLWNGCLFPLEREHHAKAFGLAPYLINHPVLTKWLYLPQQTEEFEERAEFLLKRIFRSGSYWGVVSQHRAKKSKAPDEKIDTRRPRMFIGQTGIKTPQIKKRRKGR